MLFISLISVNKRAGIRSQTADLISARCSNHSAGVNSCRLSSTVCRFRSSTSLCIWIGSQLESLKSQQLAKVGQELTLLDQKVLEVSCGKDSRESFREGENYSNRRWCSTFESWSIVDLPSFQKGTTLAHLFPQLARERKAKPTSLYQF